jgi:1-acyl-sn-glycerol-3-phosphate acyltransferase
VAAADYWSKTSLRRWFSQKLFRAVLIPRNHLSRTDDPIGTLAAVLAQGDDLILFPEGTRSLDGGIGKFHSGIHALALEFPEAELVPVYLENLNRILPKGEFLMLPLMCSATFGAPCPGPAETENRRDFLERARVALMALADPEQDQASRSHET